MEYWIKAFRLWFDTFMLLSVCLSVCLLHSTTAKASIIHYVCLLMCKTQIYYFSQEQACIPYSPPPSDSEISETHGIGPYIYGPIVSFEIHFGLGLSLVLWDWYFSVSVLVLNVKSLSRRSLPWLGKLAIILWWNSIRSGTLKKVLCMHTESWYMQMGRLSGKNGPVIYTNWK